MAYPESIMNVAVPYESGEVKIYGHEKNGFRPFVNKIDCGSKPAAIHYANTHNEANRVALGLKIS